VNSRRINQSGHALKVNIWGKYLLFQHHMLFQGIAGSLMLPRQAGNAANQYHGTNPSWWTLLAIPPQYAASLKLAKRQLLLQALLKLWCPCC